MKFCLNASVNFALRRRAITSELPPGGNGTTTVTGLIGYDWACAAPAHTKSSQMSRRRSAVVFMNPPTRRVGALCHLLRSRTAPPAAHERDDGEALNERRGGKDHRRLAGRAVLRCTNTRMSPKNAG